MEHEVVRTRVRDLESELLLYKTLRVQDSLEVDDPGRARRRGLYQEDPPLLGLRVGEKRRVRWPHGLVLLQMLALHLHRHRRHVAHDELLLVLYRDVGLDLDLAD